jgi:hypothetical protein
MTAKENLKSYKVMVNFNQDLIKNTETFKKIKFSPIIEVDNDLYKIELENNSDTLINVNCINISTGISSNSRIDTSQFGEGFFICNGKEIAAKCHSIAKKIHEDIILDAKEIYNKKFYNE